MTTAAAWPTWAASLYERADALDPAGFAGHFATDASLRFANAEPAEGRAEIEASLTDFFTTVRSMSHRLVRIWEQGATAALETVVTYGRSDGASVEVPAVTTYVRGEDGSVSHCQIYCDMTPVYA